MAKKTKAKVKVAKEPNVFDELAAVQIGPPDPESEPDKDKGDDGQKALLDRIAALEKQNEEQRHRSSLDAFRAAPAVSAPEVKPEDLQVRMDGLPDPLVEPEKYHAEVFRRQQKALRAEMAVYAGQMQQQQQQSGLAERLWHGFQEQYPEWAEKEMLVEAAAGRVVNDMKARGLDVARIMQAAPDIFNREVAQVLGKEFPGGLKGGSEDEEDDDGTDAGRTEGLPGGPTRKVTGNDMSGEAADFAKEVAELQKGIYY